jgi:hypothetical protein
VNDVAYQCFPDIFAAGFDGTVDYTDPFGQGSARTYETASWTSPEVRPGFVVRELVPSWDAETPDGSWLEVRARLVLDGGATTGWYILGRWCSTAAGPHRTTVDGQKDVHGRVDADTLVAADDVDPLGWQLQVVLLRPPGRDTTPTVRSVGAMASGRVSGPIPASAPLTEAARVLDVPAYSQQLHRGEYPQWDNGGESWCSATSLAMVLDYWSAGPTPTETAWVDPAYADPQVCHVVRAVYDHGYGGAGNWAFNTAYAATRGLRAFVTRLRDLAEAEQLVEAGIPLVASVSFTRDQLAGAGYDTSGHLLVIVGFDDRGDVVVNDPASHGVALNAEVRATYDRTQFERAWGASGGIVYLVHPHGWPLPPPARPYQRSW